MNDKPWLGANLITVLLPDLVELWFELHDKQSPVGDEIIKVYKICLSTRARVREAIFLKGSNLTKYRITFDNTKGKRNRTIPISEDLYNEIYKPTNDRLFTCSYRVVYK
ncbi:hypothetical protein A9237_13470 [Vibrio owensii]|nr:hypothetical protein A9237_13470 [Vibrio owensii]